MQPGLKKCFTAIAFQHHFRVHYSEGPTTPSGIEPKRDTSASSLC
jgi:hypothetical protein